MARRFLTAEDVRRLGGPRIQLDGETVVTPQAAEAAAAAGIELAGPAGAYAPPVPDRGPDAARARRRPSRTCPNPRAPTGSASS